MNVLLIEDEPSLLEALKSSLTLSFPTFAIRATESAEAGEEMIRDGFMPRLVICDVQLPGKSGVEFLLELQEEMPSVQFILVSAFAPPDLLQRLDHERVLRFLKKPFELNALVSEVQAVFVKDQFSGKHQRITFIDILQVLNMAQRTARIEVKSADPFPIEGEIFLLDGEVHHARCGALSGVDAFKTLCARPDAVFRVRAGERPPERSVDEPFGFLLMEAVSSRDEAETVIGVEAPTASHHLLCHEWLEETRALAVHLFAADGKILESRAASGKKAEDYENLAWMAGRLFFDEGKGSGEPLTEVRLSTADVHLLALRPEARHAVLCITLPRSAERTEAWEALCTMASRLAPLLS